MMPSQAGFNAWGDLLGDTSWSWDAMAPYFQKFCQVGGSGQGEQSKARTYLKQMTASGLADDGL